MSAINLDTHLIVSKELFGHHILIKINAQEIKSNQDIYLFFSLCNYNNRVTQRTKQSHCKYVRLKYIFTSSAVLIKYLYRYLDFGRSIFMVARSRDIACSDKIRMKSRSDQVNAETSRSRSGHWSQSLVYLDSCDLLGTTGNVNVVILRAATLAARWSFLFALLWK